MRATRSPAAGADAVAPRPASRRAARCVRARSLREPSADTRPLRESRAAAAQHQHLRQDRLGPPMRLLDHPILVRFTREDAGGLQFVMIQQTLVTPGEGSATADRQFM